MKPRRFKTRASLLSFLEGKEPRAYHVLILHGGECSASCCKCKPWFELRELTADSFLEGEKLEREWVKETAS